MESKLNNSSLKLNLGFINNPLAGNGFGASIVQAF